MLLARAASALPLLLSMRPNPATTDWRQVSRIQRCAYAAPQMCVFDDARGVCAAMRQGGLTDEDEDSLRQLLQSTQGRSVFFSAYLTSDDWDPKNIGSPPFSLLDILKEPSLLPAASLSEFLLINVGTSAAAALQYERVGNVVKEALATRATRRAVLLVRSLRGEMSTLDEQARQFEAAIDVKEAEFDQDRDLMERLAELSTRALRSDESIDFEGETGSKAAWLRFLERHKLDEAQLGAVRKALDDCQP